jgi:hypothetical protein
MEMVRPTGFEPMAPRLGIWCSILLSYGRPALFLVGRKAQGNQLAWRFIQLAWTANQLASPGGATGNGKGATSIPSSSSSIACWAVACP